MALFEAGEQEFAEAISRLTYVNPFLPDRIGLEQSALGRAFERTREVWHVDADLGGLNPNLARIEQRLGALLPALRDRLAAGASPSDREIEVYEDLAQVPPHLLQEISCSTPATPATRTHSCS